MRSPLRFTLPLITHSGDGASDAETAPSRTVCAFTGTEAAPRIIVVLFRCRQSHGAMNDPDHRPACASLAATSSVSYAWEYRTNDNAQPDRTIHLLTSSPSMKQLASDLRYWSVPVVVHSQLRPLECLISSSRAEMPQAHFSPFATRKT